MIKNEYYTAKENYQGETVREIVNKLNSSPDRDFELLDFKDLLIKTFMIDSDTITSQIDIDWNSSNIIPYGFFEKIKYYKNINKITINQINELKEKLKKFENNEGKTEVTKKELQEEKKNKLNEINSDIKNFIKLIKFA